MMLRCVVASVFVSLLGSAAWAQSEEPRLVVTSLEVQKEKREPEAAKKPDEAKPSDKKPTLSVGAREMLEVHFQVSGELDPKKLSREPMRLGLFLKREREAIASVQRGTLKECKDRFCVGIFAGNAELQFYGEELKSAGHWYVQALQNPVLEERLAETGGNKNGLFGKRGLRLGLRYDREGVTLSETSSTTFNLGKNSKRMKFGNAFRGFVGIGDWEARGGLYKAVLATKGYYGNPFSTSLKDLDIGVNYLIDIGESFTFGPSASRLILDFITTNDDEAIVGTHYAAWAVGGFARYTLPWKIWTFGSGNYVIDAGRSSVSYQYALLGSATDTTKVTRGDPGTWKHWRVDFQHDFKIRSSHGWLNGALVGFGFNLQKNQNAFSGQPGGDIFGLPENTQAHGQQFSWRASLGKDFVWK